MITGSWSTQTLSIVEARFSLAAVYVIAVIWTASCTCLRKVSRMRIHRRSRDFARIYPKETQRKNILLEMNGLFFHRFRRVPQIKLQWCYTKSSLLLDFRRGAQCVSPIRRLYEPGAPPVFFGLRLGSNGKGANTSRPVSTRPRRPCPSFAVQSLISKRLWCYFTFNRAAPVVSCLLHSHSWRKSLCENR